ncbi:aspartate aminotransferase family protein [soil metagenome]
MRLPEQGLSPDQVRGRLGGAGAHDVDWRRGRGWSLVYDSPSWHSELVDEAAARFSHENALSHSAFPSAQEFESQVVSMAASVVAPGVRSYGVFTSGGTESLMVAVKAYRDHSAAGRDEIVLPSTAHPGFGKAADYLGLRVRLVPVAADGLPDPADVIAAMGERTAMVGLSAPCFPYGVVDPIAPIARAAAERGIGVHVDAAMGGLFLPFLSPGDTPGGEPVRFGLDVDGVTSVSVDLHKYGYGAKGASVLLFATNELRHAAYHVWTGWSGGAYAASGVLGTRSVGAAAAAWTAMSALGVAGYRGLVTEVMATARRLQDGMAEQGLSVIGHPPMGVFAVTSEQVSIPAVAARMDDRGWWIDTQEPPPSLHFVVFPRHAGVAADFLRDLGDVYPQAEEGSAEHTTASSYGVMIRGGELTDQLLREHLDRRFDGPSDGD